MRIRRATVPLLSLGITLALPGCGGSEVPATGPTPTPAPGTGVVARVMFAADSIAVTQGGSAQAGAVAVDADGRPVPGATIAYSVEGSDAGVATVTTGGAVSGVKPGVTGIRASVGSVAATATLEVFGHPEGLVVGSEPLGGRPFGVAVSRHGVVYVTRLDAAAVARLDTARRVVQSIAVGATPTGVVFAPAGDLAYVTNQASRSLGIVDVAAGTQVATIPLPADPFVPFVSPDGAKLYVTSNTSRVFVADARSRALTAAVELTHAPNGFALHPDASRVYVSASVGGTVHEIDIATNAVRRTFEPGGMPQGLAVSRDGRELFVANEAGWLDVYALGTGERVARIALAGGGFGLATSPDEQHLYVSLPNTGTVQVVNMEALRVVHTLAVGGTPRRIAFTRHGGIAVIPNEAGYVSFVR